MTTSPPAFDDTWLALRAGHDALHWLAAGTTLIALEGSLRIEPVARSVHLPQALGAGYAYVVETSGWWRLLAHDRTGATLRIVGVSHGTPRLPVRAVWDRIRNWMQPRETSRG
ncbi:hypothetical protein LMG7141_03065 [Ralstonia condita]|uniref:Uncharacterized protein n=1 Tax=Ralstonia condita TaxID=3058600 RepID=A0ABM9JIR9_9RALS|nr:hypothetical protein [Ralstonia sp. LMG 7141]CAJ0795256.1 hypothetical protein LMG7141_03065 [Ralstonia sp. LMG 7141]